MNYKKTLLIGFVGMVLLQLLVPASMIFQREQVLSDGVEYKFRVRPVDPNDPFRGKFVTLHFADNQYPITNIDEWQIGQKVIVGIVEDREGYATILGLFADANTVTGDYIEGEITSLIDGDTPRAMIQFPFSRYYMQEHKAPRAEEVYRRMMTDSTSVGYAQVMVSDGRSVLRDVWVNGQSLTQLATE